MLSLLGHSRVTKLIAAARHKDELLAMVCHELRSPIASIQNAVGILRKQVDKDVAVAQRLDALIDRQLANMRLLVDDLLDVSRIAYGQVRLKRARVDLCEIVRNAVDMLQPDLARRGHRLTISLPESPVWLHADAARLEQVLVNLPSNGSKYMKAGGELALWVEMAAGRVTIRVRDTGIGIAAETLPRIFELFVQADDEMGRSGSGLGVGLALVRLLVQLHDGTVTVASRGLGQGSEFTVQLPQSG